MDQVYVTGNCKIYYKDFILNLFYSFFLPYWK